MPATNSNGTSLSLATAATIASNPPQGAGSFSRGALATPVWVDYIYISNPVDAAWFVRPAASLPQPGAHIMRTLSAGLCSIIALFAVSAAAAAEKDFKPLFDGKTLDGWHGDADLWRVEDGAIVGSTENKKLTHNSFLSTKKSYKNFILKLQFKLRNHNSGVQVRSKQSDDYVVGGYQADIADNHNMGILYEERGRGVLVKTDPAKVAKVVDLKGWNEYVIICDGPHLTFQLNGVTTVDYTEKSDAGATEGIIALQAHQGPDMEISFKNIRIKELR